MIDLTNFLQVSFDLHIQSWGKIPLKNLQNQTGRSITVVSKSAVCYISPLVCMRNSYGTFTAKIPRGCLSTDLQ